VKKAGRAKRAENAIGQHSWHILQISLGHMAKASRPSDRAAEQANYKTWKAHAAALLERQRISPGVVRERDWRHLYINEA
jgi:hypothetical protein